MDDPARDLGERLAAIEQASGALERRIAGHHQLAQRLQSESGAYNGKLDALSGLLVRVEERMRSVEQSQVAREMRLKLLEDELVGRLAASRMVQRWGGIIATVMGLAIAAAGVLVGLFWAKR